MEKVIESIGRIIREVRDELESDIHAETKARRKGENNTLRQMQRSLLALDRAIGHAVADAKEQAEKALQAARKQEEKTREANSSLGKAIEEVADSASAQAKQAINAIEEQQEKTKEASQKIQSELTDHIEHTDVEIAEARKKISALQDSLATEIAILKSAASQSKEDAKEDIAQAVEVLSGQISAHVNQLNELELIARSGTEDNNKRLSEVSVEFRQELANLSRLTGENLDIRLDDLGAEWNLRYAEQCEQITNVRDEILDTISKAIEERAEESEAQQADLIVSRVSEYVDSIKPQLKGDRGPQGQLSRVRAWVKDVLVPELGLVVHNGGLFQAKRPTEEEPGPKSKDYISVAAGIVSVDVESNGFTHHLIVEDSKGVEHTVKIDIPHPTFEKTWDSEKKDYTFYSSVVKDGHRWLSVTDKPEGEPGKSDDWVMIGMRGPQGRKGPQGPPGPRGPEGPIAPIQKILDAWVDYLANQGGTPISVYRGLWKYGENYNPGDVVNFNSAIFVSSRNDPGELHPQTLGQQTWLLLLDATVGGGDGGSGIPPEDSFKVKVSSSDNIPGFLRESLQSADGSVVFTIINPGGAEILDLQATGVGGGQANVGQNLGGGEELYVGKSGVALQFRTFGSTATITPSQNGNLMEFNVVDGNFLGLPPDDSIPKLVQTASGVTTFIDSGDSAVRDVGVGAGDVAAGDAPDAAANAAIASHNANQNAHNGNLPTAAQKSSLDNANGLSGANPAATQADIVDEGSNLKSTGQPLGKIIETDGVGGFFYSDKPSGGIGGTGFERTYEYNSNTNPGATTGTFRLNNATPASVTAVYFHETDQNTFNLAAIAANMDVGDVITFSDASGNLLSYRLTGTPTTDGTEWTFAVNYDGGSLSPVNGTIYTTLFAAGESEGAVDWGEIGGTISNQTDLMGELAAARARANHTGVQALSTISDAGTAAGLDAGAAIDDVVQVIDVGGATPGLPAIDGSQLANVPVGPHTHPLAEITDSGSAAAQDVGTTIGDVVQLEDVGGNPGLPAVDGSQLTGLPGGGSGLHADLTDLNTSGHPGSVINIPGGIQGNAVAIDASGNLVDSGTPPGGTGTTNLGNVPSATEVTITSSSGLDTSVVGATGALAGVLVAADKAKLDGVQDGAQVNTVVSVAGKTGVVTLDVADLTDSGTAATRDVPAAGDAAADECVLGNDTRLGGGGSPLDQWDIAGRTSAGTGPYEPLGEADIATEASPLAGMHAFGWNAGVLAKFDFGSLPVSTPQKTALDTKALLPAAYTRTVGTAGDFATLDEALAWYDTLAPGGLAPNTDFAVQLWLADGETFTLSSIRHLLNGPTLSILTVPGRSTIHIDVFGGEPALFQKRTALSFTNIDFTTQQPTSWLVSGSDLTLTNCTTTGFASKWMDSRGGTVTLNGGTYEGLFSVEDGKCFLENVTLSNTGGVCFTAFRSEVHLKGTTLENGTGGAEFYSSRVIITDSFTMDSLTNGLKADEGSRIVINTIPTIIGVATPYNPALNTVDGQGNWITDGNLALGNGSWTDGTEIAYWTDTKQNITTSGVTNIDLTSGHAVELTLGGDHVINLQKTAPSGTQEYNGSITMHSAGFAPQDGSGNGFQFNSVAMSKPVDLSFANNATYRISWWVTSTSNGFSVQEMV